MKQIKASEVKPGMTIRWERYGFTHEGTVERVTSVVRGWLTWFLSGTPGMNVQGDVKVTVLSEPAPPQPEEPTELGVKARVRKGRFVRLHEGLAGSNVWFEEGTGYRWTWDDLCEMGPVQVVPDQGWTVPADTPEVPERIEEWPEDDRALREHKWRDQDRDILSWAPAADKWECYGVSGDYVASYDRPLIRGPWTRVTDA